MTRKPLLIKICGVTHRDDAALAAKLGADRIGIILSPRSQRCVDQTTAKELVRVIHDHGAIPVAVFVDEGFAEICAAVAETGVQEVQLHGAGSRAAVNKIAERFATILALPSDFDDQLWLPSVLSSKKNRGIKLLYDNSRPGSGQTFAWPAFAQDAARRSKGWILAGGLSPHNIEEALRLLKPMGVDVMSGVADPRSDRLRRKDPARMEEFIALARGYQYE